MSAITEILGSDLIKDSRADINNNFDALNDDKIETSVLDTDTTLAANSDAKIPTQKAVKAYADAQGNVNASEVQRGIVEEATDAEVTAGTATGATGAKLFVTPAKLATRLPTVLAPYQLVNVFKSGIATRDLTTASGTQTIAHGVGKTPLKVKLTAVCILANDTTERSEGVFDSSGNRAIVTITKEGGGTAETDYVYTSTDYAIGFTNTISQSPFDLNNDDACGVITVDATNITITWTKSGSPTGTANIMWEAQA